MCVTHSPKRKIKREREGVGTSVYTAGKAFLLLHIIAILEKKSFLLFIRRRRRQGGKTRGGKASAVTQQ
jgi:hypothetical protein